MATVLQQYAFLLLVVPVCGVGVLIPETPVRAQQGDRSGSSEREARFFIQTGEPGLRGFARMGRWVDVPVTVYRRSSSTPFQGEIRVRDDFGFDMRIDLRMESGVAEREVIVPLLPLRDWLELDILLLNEGGRTLQREGVRLDRVLSPGEPLVGAGEEIPGTLRNQLTRLVEQAGGQVLTVPSRTLRDFTGSPGLFHAFYTPAGMSLEPPVETRHVSVESSVDIGSSYGGPSDVRSIVGPVRLVDRVAYDFLERQAWTPREKKLLETGLPLVIGLLLLCLLGGFFFRRYAFYILLGGAILLSCVLIYSVRTEADAVLQQVSVQVRYGEGPVLEDGRFGLFPLTGASDEEEEENRGEEGEEEGEEAGMRMRVPVHNLDQVVPIFFEENHLSNMFPTVRIRPDRTSFEWEDFPPDGYFLFHYRRRGEADTFPIGGSRTGEERIELENHGARTLPNTYLVRANEFVPLGSLPAGEGIQVDESAISASDRMTPEEFRDQLFPGDIIQDRTMKRFLNDLQQRIPEDRSLVISYLPDSPHQPVADSHSFQVQDHGRIVLYILPES